MINDIVNWFDREYPNYEFAADNENHISVEKKGPSDESFGIVVGEDKRKKWPDPTVKEGFRMVMDIDYEDMKNPD